MGGKEAAMVFFADPSSVLVDQDQGRSFATTSVTNLVPRSCNRRREPQRHDSPERRVSQHATQCCYSNLSLLRSARKLTAGLPPHSAGLVLLSPRRPSEL